MRCLLLILGFVSFLAAQGVSAAAQAPASAAGDTASLTPTQLDALQSLFRDPDFAAWLQNRRAAAETSAAAEATGPTADEAEMGTPFQQKVAERLTIVRGRIRHLVEALPTLPAAFDHAFLILELELADEGFLPILLSLLIFVAGGCGLEWLFWRVARGWIDRMMESSAATVGDRLRIYAIRLLIGALAISSFAAGSVGAFLLFVWPPLVRSIVLGYLIAFLLLRLAMVLGRLFLAPGARYLHFRMIPMPQALAALYYWWLVSLAGIAAFAWVTAELFRLLGFDLAQTHLVATAFGLVWTAAAIAMVWHRRWLLDKTNLTPQSPLPALLFSLWLVVIFLAWVAGARPLLTILTVAVLLPLAIGVGKRSIEHLLRPHHLETALAQPPSAWTVATERGIRALLIITAAYVLAWGFEVDLGAIATTDDAFSRFIRGAVNIVVVVLLAELVWHLARTAIDNALREAAAIAEGDDAEARRRQRLRTLLPIVRNFLLVVLLVIAVLMVLASLGVQIAPLLAGAGVVGVAVGFGAQTLVKDIISGIFYLLDDAFRVGEYIQSGSYKGTVESFSLRSVKLRHHRGPLYTVPFGELGAVQNMSRDWVIDKLAVGVTYDTDLDKVKKVIKQIGRELAEDPEFAPHILETLKMQGVEQMGDFAIQIRMKMMTKPGEQFVIRRRAYAMMKKAFAAAGIQFAFPTVTVAGAGAAVGEGELSAAAKQALDLRAKPELA